MPGEQTVHVEVVNACDQDVNVRMAYQQAALATAQAVKTKIAGRGAGVIKAIYPGPRTQLFFSVSPATDDQRSVVLPPQHADRNGVLRLTVGEPGCSEIRS